MKNIIWTPTEVKEVDYTAKEIEQAEADATSISEMQTQIQTDQENKDNLKASAKAKLIAGDPLTAEEADTIVL